MRGSRILAAALLSGLLVAIPSQTALAQQAPAPGVIVAPAAIMDLRESADFTGKVVAIQKVGIRARVSGFLEAVNFKEGDKVPAGALLYQVEDGAYRAAVQEIEGQIKAAEAARQLAVLERDRAQQLISSNTISQARVDTANAELAKAEAEIVRLNGSKQGADLNLSYTKIIAPFEGITGLTSVDVGALVGPDSDALVTLTRLDPIYVEFPVATAIFLEYRQRALRAKSAATPMSSFCCRTAPPIRRKAPSTSSPAMLRREPIPSPSGPSSRTPTTSCSTARW